MSFKTITKKVFEYFDFREFLKDYYEFKKLNNPNFSYRVFSNQIGFKTKDFILRVIQGSRNMSADSALAVAKALRLGKWETEYFVALVLFNQAKSPKQRDQAHAQMQSVMEKIRFRDEQYRLSHYQYEVYSKWYVLPVRSILGVWGFAGDYEKLANSLHPKISSKQAEEAVALLLKCRLIEEDAEKGFRLTHEAITTGDSVRKLGLKAYHQNLLKLASQSLERDPPATRNISALTLGISQESYDDIVLRLTEFRKEIAQLADADSAADRVVQLDFQLFTISHLLK